jgi:hypothetical protein
MADSIAENVKILSGKRQISAISNSLAIKARRLEAFLLCKSP